MHCDKFYNKQAVLIKKVFTQHTLKLQNIDSNEFLLLNVEWALADLEGL